MQVRPSPDLIFSQVVLVFFNLLFVSLQVFDHKIFAGELVVIGKMIYDLVVIQPKALVTMYIPDFGLKRFLTVHTVAQ